VQGILEGAEIVVLSSASIVSTKEVELSTNFLELIREAGKRDADWQATKEYQIAIRGSPRVSGKS
jgi:hypothetical protein